MDNQTQIIRAELPEIAAIIRDECWLESERRGHAVDPADVSVQERVAEIILGGAGREIRNHCGPCGHMEGCAADLSGAADSREVARLSGLEAARANAGI